MDVDYNIDVSGRRRVYQCNAAEERRLELRHEQLNKEQKIAVKTIDRDILEFNKRNNLDGIKLSNSDQTLNDKLSDDSPQGLVQPSSSSDQMQRTFSLKERLVGRKTCDTITKRFSILEEDFDSFEIAPLRHRQRSMNSLYSRSSRMSFHDTEDEHPEWHKTLLQKLQMQKSRQGIQEQSAEITARVTGCVPVNTSWGSSPLVSPAKKTSVSSKPNYMQATASSRARIN